MLNSCFKLHCNYWVVVCVVSLFDYFCHIFLWSFFTLVLHQLQRFLKTFLNLPRQTWEASATKETSKALFVESNLYFLFCSALVSILLGDVYDVRNVMFSLFPLYMCSENCFCSSSLSPPLFTAPHRFLTL